MTALSSNNSTEKVGRQDLQQKFGVDSKSHQSPQNGHLDTSPLQHGLDSGHFEFNPDQSPFDFPLDVDFDPEDTEHLIGDFPDMLSQGEEGEFREKRKSMDGKDEDDEGGRKRRESDDKFSKKPGRKPLTAEPTSVRPPTSH